MIRMFAQMTTIGRNTFIESIRQPIFTVLTLTAILALVLCPSLSAYTLDDDNKIMIDMGLSTLFLAGMLLAAFTATGVLSQEVENRTVLTVVSKPVARPVFVLGKYLGVVVALLLSYWVMTVIFLLAARHGVMQTAAQHLDGPVLLFGITAGLLALAFAALTNYFYHWVFTSTLMICLGISESIALCFIAFINKDWHFQNPPEIGDPQLLLGLLLVFLGLLIIAAVAITTSTRLGQIMTLVICAAVYFLGLMSDSIFDKFRNTHNFGNWLYSLAPNLQIFWPVDALDDKHAFTPSFMLWTMLYAVSIVSAILSLGIALFQTREVG